MELDGIDTCIVCGAIIPEGRNICKHCEEHTGYNTSMDTIQRLHIELTTMSDANEFVSITSRLPGKITVIDGQNLRVNAKSIMGMLYALEFEDLWCESDHDIYKEIQKFVI